MRSKLPSKRGPKSKSLAERFWTKVDKRGSDDCWLWTAAVIQGPSAYGQISSGGRNGKCLLAHRVSWELTHGPIHSGLCVRHTCDVKRCVNPAHLWLGTKAENSRDMSRKGRARKVGFVGSTHPMSKITEADVVVIRRRHAEGGVGFAELGREYGMTGNQISAIVKRRSWVHVGDDDE